MNRSLPKLPKLSSFALTSLLVLVIGALFTAAVILLSQAKGRLLFFPTFDAIGHMTDGLFRLETWRTKSWPGLFSDYQRNPAHAPWSSAMSLVSFAIFGIKDWAPAAANVLLIWIYLGSIASVLNKTGWIVPLLASGWFLSFPFAAWAVQEIQPDWSSALFLSIFCLRLHRSPFLHAKFSKNFLTSFFLGLSLLAKPTVFPVTLAIAITAIFSFALAEITARKSKPLKKYLFSLSTLLGGAIFFFLPHAYFGIGRDWHYIVQNSFGIKSQVWALKASNNTHWNYYLFGEGADRMLGLAGFGLISLFLGLTLFILLGRSVRNQTKHLAWISVLSMSLLIPTLNHNKQPAFGLVFYTLLFFSTLTAGRSLFLERSWKKMSFKPHFIFAVFVVHALSLTTWNWHWGFPGQDQVGKRHEIVREVLATLATAQEKKGVTKIMVVGTGDLNAPVINYLSRKNHFPAYAFTPDDSIHALAYPKYANQADLVVLGEKDSPIVANFLLAHEILPEIKNILQENEGWKRIAHFPYLDELPGYLVLQRKRETTSSALP